MLLLAIPILLISTQPIIASKHSHLALGKIHNEIAQVHQRANNYYLETEARDVSPIQVLDWILERNTTLMELGNSYGAMEISEGMEGQYKLVELWEEEVESGFSDDIRAKVVGGFGELDDSKNLRQKLLELEDKVIRNKTESLKTGLSQIKPIVHDEVENVLKKLTQWLTSTTSINDEFPHKWPNIRMLSHDDKKKASDNIESITEGIRKISYYSSYVYDYFRTDNYMSIEERFEFDKSPLKKVVEVANDVFSKKSTIDSWQGLALTLDDVSKEMDRLIKLKTESESSPIKDVLVNIENDFGQLKNYRISDKVFKKYQEIPSLNPFLEKIQSLTSYIKKVEWRVGQLSKTWKPFEEHFRGLNFPDDVSVEKFDGLGECLTNYNFSKEIPSQELNKFNLSLTRIWALGKELDDIMPVFLIFENYTLYKVFLEYDDTNLDDKIYEHIKYVQADMKKMVDFLKTRKSRHDILGGTLLNISSSIRGEIDGLDYDVVQRTMDALTISNIKQLLSCYGNLSVANSDIKNLLDSTRDMWNFDPQVLESTVDTVWMFNEAYKKAKEVSEWKVEDHDSGSPYNRFVLEEDGVQKINLVLEGLESIRQVGSMWEELKTLEIQNPDWNLFSSSLSSFIDDLSYLDSSFTFFTKTPFPSNLPIDSLRKYIKEEYEGSHRRDILKLLEKVQLLEVQYPTADMIDDLKKAMKEMREGKAGKSEKTVEKFVDCSENTCDNPPKN